MSKATRRSTKDHNLRLVLKTFYENEEISRADVARTTGLAKATVTELVNELTDQQLVVESRYGESAVGKPPLLLKIEPDGRHLICLDLANQEFNGAVVNLRGEFIHKISLPRDGRVGQEAIELVCQLVDALIEKTNQPLLGIGIGTPGLIDTAQGFVQFAVNMQWRNIPLGDYLSSRYNLPVHIANDSHMAALAEYQFGHNPPNSNLIVIKFGRGVGAGIVLNGQLYQGDHFGAGEIGHIRMVEGGLTCQCGNAGCLETIVTTQAILNRARNLAPTWPNSVLHSLDEADITLEKIFHAYRRQDALALAVVEDAAHVLGKAVASLIGILNIQTIVVSGDVKGFGDGWLNAVCQSARQNTLATLSEGTCIKFTCLSENEVIQGASALLLARELGISAQPTSIFNPNGGSL